MKQTNMEEVIKACAKGSPIGMYVIQDGKFQYTNPAFQRYAGFTQNELLGLDPLNLVFPSDWEMVRRNAIQMLKGERTEPYEYRSVIKSGAVKWVTESVVSIRYHGRRASLGYWMDMTERKRVEEALVESEKRYRSLVETAGRAGEGVAVIQDAEDIQDVIVFINEAFCNLLGYALDEVLMRPFLYFISPEQRSVVGEKYRLRQEGKDIPSRYETKLLHKDGSTVSVEVALGVTTYDRKTATVVYCRDITQQEQTRDNLRFFIAAAFRAQEEERKRIARELHDDTVQTLAALAHDIESVAKREALIPETVLVRLDELRVKTVNLMEGVRRFSHELRPDVLDRLGLIPALELLVEEINEEGNIQARIHVTGSVQRLSTELEIGLFRVAQEALRNIRKHSGATETMVDIENGVYGIRLTVSDNGCGFTVHEEPGALTREGKLGLTGMEERSRLLGGNFTLETSEGGGTTVTVEIPQ